MRLILDLDIHRIIGIFFFFFKKELKMRKSDEKILVSSQEFFSFEL